MSTRRNILTRSKRMLVASLLGYLVSVLPAMGAAHLTPEPSALSGLVWHLEAEDATSMSPVWSPTTKDGFSIVYRSPAPLDELGWFQWEGLSLVTGNYKMYVSWTRNGTGWLLGSKVLAGPDAANLREVVPSFNTVGLVSYGWEWDTVGFTNEVADNIPLLATDKVVKIMVKPAADTGELYIDDFMLTMATPHLEPAPTGPATFLETELATTRASVWNQTVNAGIDVCTRQPAYNDDLGWFQWEGLSFNTGNYNLYVSWACSGRWLVNSELWAGSDAAHLRKVKDDFYALGMVPYEWAWSQVAVGIPLLATDTVIKAIVNPAAGGDFFIDSLMLMNSGKPVVNHPEWTNSLKPKGSVTTAITLASEGKTDYIILLSRSATAPEKKAASDLSYWLEKMTGASFLIRSENKAEVKYKNIISIGKTLCLEKSKIKKKNPDLKNEGYAIFSDKGQIYLLGGKTRGPVNAVYALLEEDLGCRWYTAGSATIPYMPSLTFNLVPRVYLPVLTDRRDPYYSEAFDNDWSIRNRTLAVNTTIPAEWGGQAFEFGVHTYNTFVPPGQFSEEHPEYYMQQYYWTTVHRGFNQLCLSNPDVFNIVKKRALEYLEKNPGCPKIDFSPNDGIGACQCHQCKAINDREGTHMGTLLLFCNKLAAELRHKYPDVKVTTIAYLDTIMPPKTIRPHNVIIRFCMDAHSWRYLLLNLWETENETITSKALDAWVKTGAELTVWDYVIDFHNYIQPLPNMPVVAGNIRYLISKGVTGIMLQAADRPSYGVDRSCMKSWVWAKQLWDPSLDTRELIRDFDYGYYGKAALPMQQYSDMLWEAWEKLHSDVNSLKKASIKYGPGVGGAFLTDEFISKANFLFEKAKALAEDNPGLLDRIKLANLPIMYLQLEKGPQKDNQQYRKMIEEFEQTAVKHNVSNLQSGLRGPFIAAVIKKWRSLADSDLTK